MRRWLSMAAAGWCLAACVLVAGCPRKEPASRPAGPRGEINVFCGAGIRPPMEPLARQFEQEGNCTINMNYAGSGVLLGQLQAGSTADIYLPGDISYVEDAAQRGLVDSYKTAAWFVPVIGVEKGNPKGIKDLADLARTDLKVGIGRADACAVGRKTKELFAATGLLGRVKPDYEGLTVTDLASQVQLKALDAAIIWDATAKQFGKDLDLVPIDNADFYGVPLAAAVLKGAKSKDLALRFVDFVTGEAGAKVFRDHQYLVPGKVLHILSGDTMLDSIKAVAEIFRRETGREVETQYGDSGSLVLQAEQAKAGDILVCHDPFGDVAADKKMTTRLWTVAYLEPVMAVPKGNPKQIKGLKDLLRPDLQAGVPVREHSTAGSILWAILKKHGMYDAMDQRKPFEGRGSGELATQLKLGAVDVAVMWDAVARRQGDAFDIIPIEQAYRVDSVTSATGKTYNTRSVRVTLVELAYAKEPLLAAQFAHLATSERCRAIWEKGGFTVPSRP